MVNVTWAWLGWLACVPSEPGGSTGMDTSAAEEALVVRTAHPHGGSMPGCGSVLTRSTKLRGDVGPCPGDGLRLGANDITLDCDGHTLRGAHPWTAVVGDGRADVHIKNCRIEGFAVGISMHEAIGGSVADNRIRCERELGHPDPGVFVGDAVGVRVAHNRIRGCYTGIEVARSTVLDLVDNTITDAEDGMLFYGYVQGVKVRRNRIRRAFQGLSLAGPIVGNRFEENELSDGYFGVAMQDGARGNRYAYNFVHDMDFAGFALGDDRGEVFEHNVVSDNHGPGFWTFLAADSTRNHFEDNEVYDNEGEGFLFALGADDNVLEDNHACGNDAGDAVQYGGAGNRLIDNDFCNVTGF